jgi:predicted porin
MKKSLLALAVLGAFVGAASAQSSVTIFGVVDLSLKQVKNDGSDRRVTMGNNALNSNRLGFRGVEDLGGGLRAGFHLEGGMANDVGNGYSACTVTAPATVCTPSGGQTWQRRSTVSLMGNFGEIRLGRDYTPSFWNTTVFDPQGTNGVGDSLSISRFAPALIPTYARANNSVGYFLPALGGVYGQAMFALGEGGAPTTNPAPASPAKYVGGRIGFAAGPINVAASVGNTELDANGNRKGKVFNIAGSYKFGPATLMAQYNDDKVDLTTTQQAKESRILLGANVVVGQGEIRGSWVKTDFKTNIAGTAADESRDDATLISFGYIYNLSPRTALYAQYAAISNKGVANFAVAGGPAAPTAGGKSTGLEGGLRHSF